MILFQPFFNTFGSTWITGSHHCAIVHNHSFAVDDVIVGIRVNIELVVHLVYIVIVWLVNMLDAWYMHLVSIKNFLDAFLVRVSADSNEHDVFWLEFLS